MDFKPEYSNHILERFDMCQREIAFWAATKYLFDFPLREENDKTHFIWNYIFIDTGFNANKPIALFGFKDGFPDDREMRYFFYNDVFIKHFPGSSGRLVSSLYKY